MRLSVVVDVGGLKAITDVMPDMLEHFHSSIAQRIQTQGRGLMRSMLGRWQRGNLAESLVVDVMPQRGVVLRIGGVADRYGHDYTGDVFFGTEPHEIEPKYAKALHFNRFGADFFIKKAKHPGQKGRMDIIEALEDLSRKIVEEEADVLVKTMQYVAGR